MWGLGHHQIILQHRFLVVNKESCSEQHAGASIQRSTRSYFTDPVHFLLVIVGTLNPKWLGLFRVQGPRAGRPSFLRSVGAVQERTLPV